IDKSQRKGHAFLPYYFHDSSSIGFQASLSPWSIGKQLDQAKSKHYRVMLGYSLRPKIQP
uniref:Uncharacterized protein n=1 Tax=Oryza brachyantha TaxID=4533 RepID=J3LS97_ORYBR